MFRAEWKKLLRQRWFLGVALALFILNGALFLYRQQTEHAMWLSATDWYQEYHDQCAQMEPEAAFDWITEESLLLNDLLMVSIALDEGNMELLEILQQGRPAILKRLSFQTLDELYAAIGYGGYTALKAVNRIRDELQQMSRAAAIEKAAQAAEEAKAVQ